MAVTASPFQIRKLELWRLLYETFSAMNAGDEQSASQKEFHAIRRWADSAAAYHWRGPQDTGKPAAHQPRGTYRRADELNISLLISNGHDHDGTIDTRMLRSTKGFVDPLLERLSKYTASGSNWVQWCGSIS
jgi:hypothetical protein